MPPAKLCGEDTASGEFSHWALLHHLSREAPAATAGVSQAHALQWAWAILSPRSRAQVLFAPTQLGEAATLLGGRVSSRAQSPYVCPAFIPPYVLASLVDMDLWHD